MNLEIKEITKSFGGARVLNRVTFNLEEGLIRGLIGPNGAGKTTLFNIITGLYRPDEGDITLGSSNKSLHPTKMKPYQIARNGVGRTFQKPSIIWHLTVFENVLMGALNRQKKRSGSSRNEVKEWTAHCLETAMIDGDVWDVEPANLTISVIKKIELARAISLSPSLILFDEICSGLSHTETDDLISLILDYNAKEKCSVLFVEHDLRAVKNVCSDVVVLDFGGVIYDGEIDGAFVDSKVIEAYIGEEHA
jgi:branched-chain amino acid transport system ATP-binding protein